VNSLKHVYYEQTRLEQQSNNLLNCLKDFVQHILIKVLAAIHLRQVPLEILSTVNSEHLCTLYPDNAILTIGTGVH